MSNNYGNERKCPCNAFSMQQRGTLYYWRNTKMNRASSYIFGIIYFSRWLYIHSDLWNILTVPISHFILLPPFFLGRNFWHIDKGCFISAQAVYGNHRYAIVHYCSHMYITFISFSYMQVVYSICMCPLNWSQVFLLSYLKQN